MLKYIDLTTGEMFWVSGVKRDGTDRHWAGSGKVFIEASAAAENAFPAARSGALVRASWIGARSLSLRRKFGPRGDDDEER